MSDWQEEREYSVDYLDLGLQLYRQSEHRHRLLKWLAARIAVLSVLALFLMGGAVLDVPVWYAWAALGGSALFWLWANLREQPPTLYLLGGDERLEFLVDEPNAADLQDFLAALTQHIKDAYQHQYLDEKLDVPTDERRSRIQWLHQMKVLTRSEKDILLAELGPGRNGAIGFKRTA